MARGLPCGVKRRLSAEIMDDPGVDPAALAAALGYIERVNRWMGGRSALISHLRKWSVRWPKDRPVTLLDIATGSADLPIAAVRIAFPIPIGAI